MDRKWMSLDRLKDYEEYEKGVEEFILFASQNAIDSNKIVCPCLKCCHGKSVSVNELKEHLLANGVDELMHGVRYGDMNGGTSHSECEEMDVDDGDRIEEMAEEMEESLRDCPKMFEALSNDAKTPLYPGCTKFSKLSAILKLFNLKASNGWSDKSFTSLLNLLTDMLPDDNVLPPRTYEAKRMLRCMGLGYERIHACPNDCILYRKEYASLKSCPVCKESRYKKNEKVPSKVMWYFPIAPRFRRLFSNAEDAKNLTWHADEREVDGKLKHPADSPQWEMIDNEFPEFGAEDRNLRLALATDGMNPFGNNSTTHSTWPVMLVNYNLSPKLCMKRKYIMLTILISGPKQPGNDIDVYLAPLIEDLKMMWESGIEVYDANRKENFNLKAMLFGTINDFPAYGNLSGYSVKGYEACPICDEQTSSMYLHHCRKNVYLGHRKFLPQNHQFRQLKHPFNGKTEDGVAPLPLSGEEVFDKVKKLNVTFGKLKAVELPTKGHKKSSTFFQLPYWNKLYVRHNLDIMHIEKNICDSLIGTLLQIPGKTKDTINARKDMLAMEIRDKLAPVKRLKSTLLPAAHHTLSRKEKKAFCSFLASVKVPEGHCSNIRSLVSLPQLKLIGLKSHDCHILMQQLLPVALRAVLPEHVRHVITSLCSVFTVICSKAIDPSKLDDLQKEVIEILCQLEVYFAPFFFDIMVHLTVHLIREVQLCGPAYLRYMYPIERYMKILKSYVMNRSRPEGCIVERYILEEALEFCSSYLSGAEAIGLPKPRSSRRTGGRGSEVLTVSDVVWSQAHLYVLNNSEEVDSYIGEHLAEVQKLNPRKSKKWVRDEHNRTFIQWLREHIFLKLEQSPKSVSERLKWLALGPRREVLSYRSYYINGCTFSTKDQDAKSTTQNSGVTLVAQAMHISSAKDKNPLYAKMSYYGVIENIWELDYSLFRMPVFGCKWVDNRNGVEVDKAGFTLVDLNKVGNKSEPFILASQAKQVFYVPDPVDEKWWVVLLPRKRKAFDDPDESDFEADSEEFHIPLQTEFTNLRDEAYDLHPNHNEGVKLRHSRKLSAQYLQKRRKR